MKFTNTPVPRWWKKWCAEQSARENGVEVGFGLRNFPLPSLIFLMNQTFVNKITAFIERWSARSGGKKKQQTSKPNHSQSKGYFLGENSGIFRHGKGAAGETMMEKIDEPSVADGKGNKKWNKNILDANVRMGSLHLDRRALTPKDISARNPMQKLRRNYGGSSTNNFSPHTSF